MTYTPAAVPVFKPLGTDGKRVLVTGFGFAPGMRELFRKTVPSARAERYGHLSVAVKWIPSVEDFFAGRPFSQETPAQAREKNTKAECAAIVASGIAVPKEELRKDDHVRIVAGPDLGMHLRVRHLSPSGCISVDRANQDGSRFGNPRSLTNGWSDDFPRTLFQIIDRKEE